MLQHPASLLLQLVQVEVALLLVPALPGRDCCRARACAAPPPRHY
jgi:hypothetical protein